jgi:hypothetical protein
LGANGPVLTTSISSYPPWLEFNTNQPRISVKSAHQPDCTPS